MRNLPSPADEYRPTGQRDLGIASASLDEIVHTLRAWHEDGDQAMQFALCIEGELVLDVAIGKDPFADCPITRDSLFCILSASKGLAALVFLHLVDIGIVSWDDLVTRYWPTYGHHGKGTTTLGDVLSHRAGLPALTCSAAHWPDRAYMSSLIENAHPAWVPGTGFGYHGGIFGAILDEVCQRATGFSIGEHLARMCADLGCADCYLGVPVTELKRVVKLMFLEADQRGLPEFDGQEFPPFGRDGEFNSDLILTSGLPSSGAVACARDLAGIYSVIAGRGASRGKAFWSPEVQVQASCAISDPRREIPRSPGLRGGTWGYGFLVPPTPNVFGTVPLSTETVGHAGASGAVAFADPRYQVSAAFTINGVQGDRMLMRMRRLGDLVREVVHAR